MDSPCSTTRSSTTGKCNREETSQIKIIQTRNNFRLAELQTEMELFRGAIYSAVDAMMAGQNVTMHASMLKLKAGRLCRYLGCVILKVLPFSS